MRKKAEAEASPEPSSEETAATGNSQAWAMLIKRVYEVDPLSCPECGGQMQVVSFIEPRAPERSDGRGRRDRSDPQALWPVAGVVAASATRDG